MTYSTDAGKDSSIEFSIPDSTQDSLMLIPDTLLLRMDSTGQVSWSAGAIQMTELQQKVQDTLLGYYLHADSLPAHIQLQLQGTVTMGIRGVVYDQLSAAQEVVRNVIAVKEWRKSYHQLSADQKAAFQQRRPVLFQTSY